MPKPIIAVTMGDAAGIGPELIVKLLRQPATYAQCRPLVIGDPGVMRDTCTWMQARLQVREVHGVVDAGLSPEQMDVLCPRDLHLGPVTLGKLDAACGRAAALCLQEAAQRAMAGEIQGMVSAPMNKEAFHLGGYDYMDELAFLSAVTQCPEAFVMGVITPALWSIAVTEHIPFRAIVEQVKADKILTRTRDLHLALRKVGFDPPRLAVAALNVHGGEGGLFGREELDEIAPAVERARAEGIQATGPLPADTIFVRARAGEFDGVVCLYHDQANIARKLLATHRGATLFMGLPVPWGTTAHGTAFDKAGQGVADVGSLADALHYTVLLAQ
jgi:4-phospho-D-threonate 3-dehydrogenase / 4-phospho-D-erythronate 3-dehydrogenase